MRNHILDFKIPKLADASFKARADILTIAKSEGYDVMSPTVFRPETPAPRRLVLLAKYLVSWLRLPRGSRLLLQYPLKWGMYLRPLSWLCHKRRVQLVCVVHDLESQRWQEKLHPSEVLFLNLMDIIIVHSEPMALLLREGGVTTAMKILGLFDYLAAYSEVSATGDGLEVVFAGNLAKSGFVKRLFSLPPLSKIKLNLYGTIAEQPPQRSDIRYMGVFAPNEIGRLRGDWGLVWDGDSLDTCDGNLGRYLRINSSHKASLYLAAGMPLIVWSESALAGYVAERKLGIAVASLCDIEKTLESLSPEQVAEMKRNVAALSRELKHGNMLRRALAD